MKHLKRIFENTSNELPDDIQDAIINIVDELGEPVCDHRTVNGITTYYLKWRTRFNYRLTFTDFNEKIEKIYKVRHDIGSVKGRLSKNYESNFFLEDGCLTFTIKTKTPFEYNFIKQIDTEKKIVYLNESEIIRFFDRRGLPLKYIKSFEKSKVYNFPYVEISCKSKDCSSSFEEFESAMKVLLSKTNLEFKGYGAYPKSKLYEFILFERDHNDDRLEYKIILEKE